MSQFQINKNISINMEMCYLTYPCQHDVLIDGECSVLSAVKICKLCMENNVEIPGHFMDYKEMALKKIRNKCKQYKIEKNFD